jgi:hypothetical protein
MAPKIPKYQTNKSPEPGTGPEGGFDGRKRNLEVDEDELNVL